MKRIKQFEQFINESVFDIPENILDHWLYHYDLWCEENGQEPEYDDVEELMGNESAINHVYYHANIYAQKNGFRLDGDEFMEDIQEKINNKSDIVYGNLTEGKVSDVEHLGHGLRYHNEIFGGFNSPKKYEGKGKHKFRVLAREGDKIKVINFGKRDDIKREDLTKLSKKYWEHFWK